MRQSFFVGLTKGEPATAWARPIDPVTGEVGPVSISCECTDKSDPIQALDHLLPGMVVEWETDRHGESVVTCDDQPSPPRPTVQHLTRTQRKRAQRKRAKARKAAAQEGL